MKHTIFIMVIAVCLSAVIACGPSGKKGSGFEVNFGKDASYALGMNLGSNMQADSLYPDLDEFLQGIIDVISGNETRFTPMDASMLVQQAFEALRDAREAASMQEEIEFLAENREKPGINETESGLQFEIITEGDGEYPSLYDTVRVHYEGSLIDGTVFDSSYMRGEPAEFPLRGVIPGWTEGLQLMSIGSSYIFYIPSELGYGAGGWGPIPPYSTLIFSVELLDILN